MRVRASSILLNMINSSGDPGQGKIGKEFPKFMKELNYTQDRPGPGGSFDNGAEGRILFWMHPKKAINTLAAFAALVVATGCETTAADPVPQATVVLPAAQPVVVVTQAPPATVVVEKKETVTATTTNAPAPASAAAPSTNVNVAAAANTSTNAAPEIKEEVAPTIPENIKVTPATEKIIQLANGGVDENVMLAFVEKSDGKFGLEADEIVYLSDIGVPSAVLTAMLKKDGDDPKKADVVTAITDTEADQPAPKATTQLPTNGVVEPAPQVVEVTTNYVPTTTVVQAPPQTVVVQQPQTVVVAPPPTETVSYFYDSLSPYGSWMYVSDYGWCWQPTVAVVDRGWRPYGPRGHWVYSTSGWYWHSDYSWGWAPFHYGRWHMAGHRGWLWVPDRVWGPAWVSWRVTDDYCGWAPLPPAAVYRPGFGFSYYGSSVGVSFGFGLGYDAYCFAPVSRFHDRHVWRHSVYGHHAHTYYNRSYVHNRYDWNKDRHHPVNNGVPRQQIERAIQRELRPVEVREASAQQVTTRVAPRERIERSGRDSVIVRPALPRAELASNIRTSSSVTTANPLAGGGSAAGGTAGGRFNRNGQITSRMPAATAPAPTTPAPGTRSVESGPGRTSRSVVTAQPATAPAPATVQPTVEPRTFPSRRDRVLGSTSPNSPAPVVTAPAPAPMTTPSSREAVRREVNRGVTMPSRPVPTVSSPSPAPSPIRRDRSVESSISSPSPRAYTPAPQPVTPLPRSSSPSPQIASPSPRYSSPSPVTVSPSPRYSAPAPSPVSPAPSRSYQSTPSTSGRYSTPAPAPTRSAPSPSPAPSRTPSSGSNQGSGRDRRDRN
jgi:hypothetical protein